jgi:hypothetical protein
VIQPVQQRRDGFHDPAEGVVAVVVQVLFAGINRGVDETAFHFPDNRLVVRVTNIGMRMVDQVNGL